MNSPTCEGSKDSCSSDNFNTLLAASMNASFTPRESYCHVLIKIFHNVNKKNILILIKKYALITKSV